MQPMLVNVSPGFGEHGHLMGKPCIIGVYDVDADSHGVCHYTPPAAANLPFVLLVKPPRLDVSAAEDLVEAYRGLTARGCRVHVCARPRVQLREERMACDAILRVVDADDFDVPPDCDDRYASVSVHTWPGGPIMRRLSQLRADLGKVISVTGDDLGHAKVWLRGSDPEVAGWSLVSSYPFNESLEPAELDEMYTREK